MKTRAERITQGSQQLAIGDKVFLRMENLKPNKIDIVSLIGMRLKITPLVATQTYKDPDPDDIELQTEVDYRDGNTAEGDIINSWNITHGGPNVTSKYTDDIEIIPGYERDVEVTYYEPIEEGD